MSARRTSSTERSGMPLRTAMAWRRKLSTLTPEISSGCWKPRKMPRAARSSVGSAVTSSPRNRIAARVTSVGGVGEEGVGERRLARAVGAHQGVDLALADREAQSAQDLGAVDGDVEVVDLEQRGSRHGPDSISTTAVVEIRMRPASGVSRRGRRR